MRPISKSESRVNISIAPSINRATPSSSCESAKRDVSAAKRFFRKMMRADHRSLPFTISVDKNAAYPEAFTSSQEEKLLPKDCKLRRVKYLNNIIEQDHRFVKKKMRASRCFKTLHTAERTLEGIEAVNMMRKGQVKRISGNDAVGQAKFVTSLFGNWRVSDELCKRVSIK